MTILGKFFTVLIFVLSAIFMAFSVMVFVTHKNWRDYATSIDTTSPGLELKLKQQQDLVADLQRELQESLNRLAAEQASRRFAIAVMQTKVTQLESDLQQSEKRYTDLIASHGLASASLKANTERLTALVKQVEDMRAEVRVAQLDRDSQFMLVVSQTDDINQANGLKL